MLKLIIGSLIAMGVVIFVEYQRKPRLKIEIAPAINFNNLMSLRLRVKNLPLPFIIKWISRQSALQCHGDITYHDPYNGQNIFGREMQIRWVNNPQPIPLEIKFDDGKCAKMYDPIRFTQLQRMDIYAGEYEDLDVAVRFKEDRECYGWNDESYRVSGRNPDWRLDKDQYLIKLTLRSSGEKVSKKFRLLNPNRVNDFRIEDSKKDDPELN